MKTKLHLIIIVLFLQFSLSFSQNFWDNLTLPQDLQSNITAYANSGNIYLIAVDKAGVFRTSDNGKSWNKISTKVMDADSITIIIIKNNNFYLAGQMTFYCSIDGGSQWIINSQFMQTPEYIKCMDVNNQGEIILGTNYGIYRSSANDNGAEWVTISYDLGNFNGIALIYDANNAIFTCGNKWSAQYSVYELDYKGQTWIERKKGFAAEPFVGKFLTDSDGRLWASVWNELYEYDYKGQQWTKGPNGELGTITGIIQGADYLIVNDESSVQILNRAQSVWYPRQPEMILDKDKIISVLLNNENKVSVLTGSRSVLVSKLNLNEIVNNLNNPGIVVILKNANGDVLPNQVVKIYKGSCDGGAVYLGEADSDNDGKINLKQSGFSFRSGDYIKIEKTLEIKPAIKSGHEAVDNIMYEVRVNNRSYDRYGNPEYQFISNENEQSVALTNTVVYLNLVVCTQWDAPPEYLDTLKSWFKKSAEFIYDVFDGQMILNKVAIYDNSQKWIETDVRIFTSNIVWPGACMLGINRPTPQDAYICFERRWFGGPEQGRQLSTRADWYRINDTLYGMSMSTTMIHEVGHYFLGFDDEYRYTDRVKASQLPYDYNYGFMQNQYVDYWAKAWNSEMSSAVKYLTDNYKITAQWNTNKSDCWTHFEKMFEKDYNIDGATYQAKIRKPSESSIGTFDYMVGPNDWLTHQSKCPASEFAQINVYNQNTNAGDYTFRLINNNYRDSLKAKVYEIIRYPNNVIWFKEIEGEPTYRGEMRAIGCHLNDKLLLSGKYVGRGNDGVMREEPVISNFNVSILSSVSKKNDNSTMEDQFVEVETKAITGAYELVPKFLFGKQGFDLSFIMNKKFNGNVVMNSTLLSDTSEVVQLSEDGNNYNGIISNYAVKHGMLMLSAKDEANEDFDFIFNTSIMDFAGRAKSADGGLELYINPNITGVEKIAILTSIFPTSRNGIGQYSVKASDVYCVSSYPGLLKNDNESNVFLSIKYNPDLLFGKSQNTLSVFKWDEVQQKWIIRQSVIDSLHYEVIATFDEPGIFALFTSDDIKDVKELNDYRFIPELTPNPTAGLIDIKFVVPQEGPAKIEVLDILGNVVKTVKTENLIPFSNKLTIDCGDLPGAVYILRIEQKGLIQTSKFSVVK